MSVYVGSLIFIRNVTPYGDRILSQDHIQILCKIDKDTLISWFWISIYGTIYSSTAYIHSTDFEQSASLLYSNVTWPVIKQCMLTDIWSKFQMPVHSFCVPEHFFLNLPGLNVIFCTSHLNTCTSTFSRLFTTFEMWFCDLNNKNSKWTIHTPITIADRQEVTSK